MYQEKGKIAENVKLAEGIFMMSVESSRISRNARPGQFAMVSVSCGVDPLLRRPLSFHDAGEGAYVFIYKVVGRGTSILSKKSCGDEVDSLGPLGREFKFIDGETLLVAGGMGIAPLFFLGRSLIERGIRVNLIYGGRTAASLVRVKEFESVGVSVNTATEDGSAGFRGTAVELFRDRLTDLSPDAVYACGPAAMLKEVIVLSKSRGLRTCQVSVIERMACGVGACLGCSVPRAGGGYLTACKDGPVFDAEEILI